MKKIVITRNDYSRIHESIHYAKINNSIRTIEAENLVNELQTASIVDPHDVPGNVVTMNSIVRIRFPDSGKSMVFQVVYPDAANIKENKISIFSPVATALIGYKAGDTIEWIVPSGPTKIRIEEIIYQPEAAGQLQL
ncbi:MAG TPA: nucleoside diphosphate kinase regulator [Bacteroidales bacterium]|jgi:regulator of nucleoside diphosphate kinase|nr:nucleoside diphosphate kinase regulator [Bacteroidales bacterium]